VIVCSANPPGSNTDRIITLRPGGSGEVTQTHRLWEYRPYNPDASTPVCYKDNVYMVRDDGVASCLDLNTGGESGSAAGRGGRRSWPATTRSISSSAKDSAR